jgi:hypothetical protein
MSDGEGWISARRLTIVVRSFVLRAQDEEEEAHCCTTSAWERRARDATFFPSMLEYAGRATSISFCDGAEGTITIRLPQVSRTRP